MDAKFNDATNQRLKRDRIIDAPLVTLDIPLLIEQIRKEKLWKDNDRNAITVFKTNGMSIVLIALHEGAEMIKHIAKGIISLQILEGKIRFSAEEQTIELDKGQMLTLHDGIPHSLLAIEETIFLLTLAITQVKK
jgi:quercetin dioxygenase-like cupin family protein